MKRGKKKIKRKSVSRTELRKFYLNNNIIALLLLIYIIVIIVCTAKVLDRFAEIERTKEYYITGSASDSGSVSIVIEAVAEAAGTNETAEGGTNVPGTASMNLDFDPDSFIVKSIQKEKAKRSLNVKNIGDITLNLVGYSTLEKYVDIFPESFVINPGNEKVLTVIFDAEEIGIHTGYVIVQDASIMGYVPFIFDVSSKDISKVDMRIDDKFKEVIAGEEISIYVMLTDFKIGLMDINYVVKDLKNNVILSDVVSMPITKDKSFYKTLKLPETLKSGTYISGVEVTQNDDVFVDSDFFVVVSELGPGVEKAGFINKIIYSGKLPQGMIIAIMFLIFFSIIIYAKEFIRVKKVKKSFGKNKKMIKY